MRFDPALEKLLERLYARSSGQEGEIATYFASRAAEGARLLEFDERSHRFMRDKLVALDRDKAELCYALCRALGASRVVEAGTSYGVSTLFLAAAVRDNARSDGGRGVVIGTEYEPEKAAAARAHFEEAGLTEYIELREGDLRETLRDVGGPVDFVLVDIWTPLARPALELVAPHLRPGALVCCDNTEQFREAYADYFAFLGEPRNRFRTLTLPFQGGFELSVREA